MEYFTETINKVLQGIKSLTTTDRDNQRYYRHHCLLSNIYMLHSVVIVDIHFLRLLSAYILCFQPMIVLTHLTDTHALFSASGTWKYRHLKTTAVH